MYEITTEGFAVNKDALYAVGREIAVVFKISMITGKIEVLNNIPIRNYFQERLFNGICADERFLALIPFNANEVWIYEFATREWRGVDITDKVEHSMKSKFVGGCIINGLLWMFGYGYKGILVVNLDNKEVNSLDYDEKGLESFWNQSFSVINNHIYLTPLRKDEVICIDAISKKIERVKLGRLYRKDELNSNCGISGKDALYITKHHGNILYRWLPLNNRIEKLEIDSIFDNKKSFFNGITSSNNKVFLYSPIGKSYFYNYENPNESKLFEEKIFFASFIDNIGLIVCQKGMIKILDEKLNVINEYRTEISQELHDEYISKSIITEDIITENNFVGISDFLIMINN